jgi:hypothetical protein
VYKYVPSGGDDYSQLTMYLLNMSPGDTLQLIPGTYRLSQPLSLFQPVNIVGAGQWNNTQAPQNSPQWNSPGIYGGTVFQCTGSGAFTFTGRTRGIMLSGLAAIGTGTGTAITCSSINSTLVGCNNVFLGNWQIGLDLKFSVQTDWATLQCTGCGIGVWMEGGGSGNTQTDLDDCTIQACGVGIQMDGGAQTRISGVMQTNTRALVVNPTVTAITGLLVDWLWCENNNNTGMEFIASAAGINNVSVRSSRCGSASQFLLTLSKTCAQWTCLGNYFPNSHLTIPAQIRGGLFAGNQWAATPTNSGTSVQCFDVL